MSKLLIKTNTKSKTELLNNQVVASRQTSWNTGASLFLSWLPNPNPVLKKAGKTIEVFKELLTDPFVKGCFNSRKAATLSLEWTIAQDASEPKYTEFIQSAFNKFDFFEFLSNILDTPAYGYQVFEIVWELNDGHIVPADIIQKPAEWFAFDEYNRLLFKSKNHPDGELVPDNKFLVVRHNGSYNNPYGEPVLSDCFWPATFKKGGLKFWVTFTEKYGMPWIVAKAPPSFDEKQVDELIDSISSMVQDGVVSVPNSVDVDMKFAGNDSVDIYDKLLQFCKDEISMAFLGHTKAGQSVPGELGNQNQSKEIRADITLHDKHLCESAVNNLINIIHKLNFDSGEAPKFSLYEETDIDKELAERDKIMYDMGVRFSDEYIQKTYFLDKEDFNIDNAAKPVFKLDDKKAPVNITPPLGFADKSKKTAEPLPDGQVLIDDAAKKVLNQSKELIGNLNKQIKDYLHGAADFTAAIDGLAQLYPKLNSQELYDKLVSIQFAADLVGRFQVKANQKR